MEISKILETLKTAQGMEMESRKALEQIEDAVRKNYTVMEGVSRMGVNIFYDPINQALLLNGKMVTTDETAVLFKYFKFLEEAGLAALLPDTKETIDEKV